MLDDQTLAFDAVCITVFEGPFTMRWNLLVKMTLIVHDLRNILQKREPKTV